MACGHRDQGWTTLLNPYTPFTSRSRHPVLIPPKGRPQQGGLLDRKITPATGTSNPEARNSCHCNSGNSVGNSCAAVAAEAPPSSAPGSSPPLKAETAEPPINAACTNSRLFMCFPLSHSTHFSIQSETRQQSTPIHKSVP